MRGTKRFLSMALAALLVFSTLASDYMVANAEEIVEETTEVSETEEVVEVPVWEEIPEEETVEESAGEEVAEETVVETPEEEIVQEDEQIEDTESEITDEEVVEEEVEEVEEEIEEVKEETTEVGLSEEPIEFASVKASNGLVVKVYAPAGAFPEGTEIVVTAISNAQAAAYAEDALADDETEVIDAKGVDITFKYEGEEIEPAKAINVTFDNANLEDAEDYSLIHVDDNQNTEVIGSADVDQNGAEAKLDEFSIYVVAGVGQKPSYNVSELKNLSINKGETAVVYSDYADTTLYYLKSSVWTIEKGAEKYVKVVQNPGGTLGYAELTGLEVTDREYTVTHEYKLEGKVFGSKNNGKETFKVKVVMVYPTASFNLGGASGTAPKAITAAAGATITLPTTGGSKSGYEFAGWTLNGVEYAPGAAYVMGEESVTFTAVFKRKITFNINGGNKTAPAAILASKGEEVKLPDYTGTNGTKAFVGWGTISNATDSKKYTSSTVYPAGSIYTMGSDNVTLYATWASKNVNGQFFIRLDGTLPTEPQSHDASEYGAAIDKSGVIKEATFTHNISGSGVEYNLDTSKLPSTAEIQNSLKGKNVTYNPDTQYVLWYVIKHEATWHIDGVLLQKALVNLAYDANAPAGIWSNMPDGKQYAVGAVATVSDKIPTRSDGYTFTGWNTKADGTGTAYGPNASITMNENVTLYAQWENNTLVKLFAPSAEKTYDGTALTKATGLTWTGLPAGYTVTAEINGSQTVVGTADNVITSYIIKNEKGVDVTVDYKNVVKEKGTLKVKPAPLTIVTESAQKAYDGSALTAPGSITGFVNGETATFTVTGSQTLVGSSSNTYSLVWDGTAVATNYTVSETKGTLVVSHSNAKITVTTVGGTFTYDGKAHGATVTVSTLPTGYTLETATSADTATHVAEGTVAANCDTLVIKDANGVDVTDQLNIEYIDGTIEITPATLTVVTPDDEKIYDGTPLTKTGTITGFVNNETATFATTGTQTAVGESTNTYSLVFDKTAAATDYTVSEDLGTLKVTEFAGQVTVVTTGGTFEYDGQAHGATVEVNGLPTGYTVQTATSDDKATHVSEGTVEANCDHLVIVNAQGEDVTKKLNISYTDGSIVITPVALTVKTETASKVYDGDPLTADGSIEGFVGDETATFTVTGSQTAVGTSDNTYTLVFDQDAEEDDYTVNASIGSLTVTENDSEIVVTTTGGIFTYDGEAHGATVEVSELPKGYTLVTATSDDTATHVAEGEVAATCDTLVIKNAQGVDVTSKLSIKYINGTIKITPATLTVTTPNAEKVYDGTPLTAEGSIDGFVKQETATFTTTGTRTAVGTSNNTYTLVFDQTAAESDYTVEDTVGTLTVTENNTEITVTTVGGIFPYDGKAHGATVTVSELPTGYRLDTATSNDTATHVAEGVVPADCDKLVILNAAGEDVTSKLNIKYVNDTIKITPVKLTVVTPDDEKVYDGTPLTKAGTITGFVNGETATFTTTGTQTEVGSSANTYEIGWAGSTARKSDYVVDETIGTLTVTEFAGQVTVVTTGGTFEYDGQAHGATVEVNGLPTGYSVQTATSDDTATHVSEGTVEATCDHLVIVNAQNEDVTEKLNISYTDGSIKITPATLTVTTESDSKVYDGEALTADGDVAGFVNGETATFTVTGSQTEVGTSDNTYTLVFNQTAKEADYTVNATVGKLTVTENADEIVVTTTGGTFTYDGDAHGATVAVSTLPSGYRLVTATSDDEATHVADGTVDATCDTLVIVNAQGVDVTSKLNIRYVDGTIEITPATLTVVTPNAEKVYDGTALTAEGSVTGFVNNETATFTTTGTQTAVGTSDNTYTLAFNKTAAESDYTVEDTVGTLTVTENNTEITVTTVGGTFPYDGQAHGATVTVSTLPAGYVLDTATSDDTATHVAEGVVPADCDKLVILNAAGEDVTSKLNIKYVNDTIEITPAALTVVTPNAEKVYDGTALTAEGSISGFVNNETATFTTTGTRTAVGTSDNTYTLAFNKTAVATDYTVSEDIGTLKVTEFAGAVTVVTTGGTFEYDGKAHGATVEVNGLPTGYSVQTATSDDKATHVSEGTVEANCDHLVIVNAQGEDVTAKLQIAYEDGNIVITPVTLTVTTETDSKVYDGEALTAEGTITGFVGDETATFTVTGSQTEVGSSDNTYTLVFDQDAEENDYTVDETVGKLTVTENADEIVVTTVGGSYTYDGTEKAATISTSTIPKGYVLAQLATNAKATDVTDGTLDAKCDAIVIKNAAGTDVTSRLKITYVNDTLEVKPAELTITTPTADKVYDGAALEAEGTITGFVKGESVTFTTTGTQTNVGESENGYDIVWDNAKESNYVIGNETIGTLTVTPAPLTVITESAKKVYDGEPLTAAGEMTGFVNEETATFTVTGSQTVVGTSDNTYEITWDGTALDTNYELVSEEIGTLEVTEYAEEIIVKTTGGTFEYDGLEHGAKSVVEGMPEKGYTLVTYESTAIAKDVADGIVDATCDKLVIENAEGEDVTSNLNIKYIDDTIQITPAPLTLVIPSVEKEYDGQPIVIGTLVPEGLKNGETLEITFADIPKDVCVDADGNVIPYDGDVIANSDLSDEWVARIVGGGEVIIGGGEVVVEETFSAKFAAFFESVAKFVGSSFKSTSGGKADPNNYNLNLIPGNNKILPKPVTVTTESAQKEYDGKALTAPGKLTGIVDGETYTFKVTGEQKTVGSSKNKYSLKWDGTALAKNYVVSEKLGTLKVIDGSDPNPGDDPDPTPGPGGDPTPTPTNIPDEPTPTGDGAGVLGARRGVEADGSSVLGARREQAVLGARRGAQTGDENAMAMYLLMMGASASMAGLYTIARRKKRNAAK